MNLMEPYGFFPPSLPDLLERGIVKEIRIDECCDALLLSTDSIHRGLHNSSIYSLYTGPEIVNHRNLERI